MSVSPALHELAAAYGVATSYDDQAGTPVTVNAAAVVSALAALGVDASTDEAAIQALQAHSQAQWERLLPPVTVVREGAVAHLDLRGPQDVRLSVLAEDGIAVEVPVAGPVLAEREGRLHRRVALPPLPLGWHRVIAAAAGQSCEADLVVTPQRLPAPAGRTWGWMVQLYALRSAGSWGVGDYADLQTVVAATREAGGGVVLGNPLHAENPTLPVPPSPYSPSSRLFRSPLCLRIENVPELDLAPQSVRAQVLALRPATDPDRVARDPAWAAKLSALDLLWPHHRDEQVAAFRSEIGQPLEDFALFCALAESHGVPWQDWPSELRRPDGPGIPAARDQHAERITFWCWVQLLVDEQLSAVTEAAGTMTIGVLHDLAVGVDAGGADAWVMQDVLALTASAGAPPDAFSQQGQDWGLPPWRPDRLREQGYRPYRDLVRGVLRHAGGIRVDHVLGLFRLWWVPAGSSAADGTYVAYDAEAMLGILALEAHRAGAVVVGEDLGTVEPRVLTALESAGVLGCSVLWFQQDDEAFLDPAGWRADTVASITTHDLPTAAGYLAGEHVRVRAELGTLAVPVAQEQATADREMVALLAMLERTGTLGRAGGDPVLAMHLALAESPCRVVLAALGDAVGDLRQPNLPGTIDEYPNWRLPVADASGAPLSVEDLLAHPGVARLAALLTDTVR